MLAGAMSNTGVAGVLRGDMSKRLFVVVPGLQRRLAVWKPLLARLEADVPDALWLVHDHRASPFSRRSIHAYGLDLAAVINERVTLERPDHITLMGHSFGGVLVRMAYLMASGGSAPGARHMPWAGAVDRIILFAAMNRGFEPSRLGFALRWPTHAALALPPPLFGLLRDMRCGSDAMTDLRIAWIRLFRTLGAKQPVVIQLKGALDTLVHEADSVDVEQFPNARQVLVAGATHSDLHTLPKGREDERYGFLRDLILSAMGDEDAPRTDATIEHVVFLVHGIRASNSDWPAQVSRIIETQNTSAVGIPAGYGYFSALNFAVPFLRRRQIRWLQDEYSLRFACHRNAKFHFIGHSNGTYLLGHALRRVPSVQFDRVALVGSVLPESFEWARHIGSRVMQLRNHRANRDLPVALLCNLLRGLGMRDVGTAGFDGFQYVDPKATREVFYYEGGHGAPLKDTESLTRLVTYVLTGQDPPLDLPNQRSAGLALVSRLMRTMAWVVVLLLAVGLWLLAGALVGPLAAVAPVSGLAAHVAIMAALVALLLIALKIA